MSTESNAADLNDAESDASVDPFGYRRDVLEALEHPGFLRVDGSWHPGFESGAEAELRVSAASWLCVALGRCRLYDISSNGRFDGALPSRVAQIAATQFVKDLSAWTQAANELPDDWGAARDPTEADDLCGGLLQARMDAWASWLAIDESYTQYLTLPGVADDSFEKLLDRVLDSLEQFDSALKGHLDLLSTIADWHLLDDWRSKLAYKFRSPLPWWLDGTLESVFAQQAKTAEEGLPSEKAWRHLSRRRR